jgi:hypothetical protein
MSSTTAVRLRPPKPKRVAGQQVTSLDQLLGDKGRTMIGETLESLCQPLAPVLAEHCLPGASREEIEGEIEGLKREMQLGWQRVARDSYVLHVTGEKQLTDLQPGLSSLKVTINLGGGLATVGFDQTFTPNRARLSAADQKRLNQACQVVANRAFNRVLSLVVEQRLRSRLRERKALRVVHKVQNQIKLSAGARPLLRTSAVARTVSRF